MMKKLINGGIRCGDEADRFALANEEKMTRPIEEVEMKTVRLAIVCILIAASRIIEESTHGCCFTVV